MIDREAEEKGRKLSREEISHRGSCRVQPVPHANKHTPLPNMQAPTHSPTQSGTQALKDHLNGIHIRPLPAGGGMASDWTQVATFTNTHTVYMHALYTESTHTCRQTEIEP